MFDADPLGVAAAESFPRRKEIRALPIDEGKPTDVNTSAMEEVVICAPLEEGPGANAAVSIDRLVVTVLMASTEGIVVTNLVTVLVTSIVVMV